MCLQCITDAIYIKREALPGFALMQAQKDGSIDWPKGAYALVDCNDPFMVIPTLQKDPAFGLTEEEMRECFKDPKFTIASDFFDEEARKTIDALPKEDPMWGYALVSACLQAGYNPGEHGYNVYYWLFNHLAGFLDAPENLHHSHAEPEPELGVSGLTFAELTAGDRFKAHGAVWTKLSGGRSEGIARKHGEASCQLGLQGFGYIGDSVCSFDSTDPVEFLPVEVLV